MARLIEGVLNFPDGTSPTAIEITFKAALSSATSGVIEGFESIMKVDGDGNYQENIEDGVYDIHYTLDGVIHTQLGKNVSIFYGDPIDLLTLIGASEVTNNPIYIDNFTALIASFNTVIDSVELMKVRQRDAFTPERMERLGSISPEDRLDALANMMGALSGVDVQVNNIDLATDTELEQAVTDIETDLGSFTEFRETFNTLFNTES